MTGLICRKTATDNFELDEGEIIEMSRPGERYGVVCGNASWLLGSFTRQRKKGYICTNDTGLILERDPNTVRGADVAIYDEAKRYEELNIKYTEGLPLLAVEVLSPNDRAGKMMRRSPVFGQGSSAGLGYRPRSPGCYRFSSRPTSRCFE